MKELTLRAVLVGLVLAVVMGAANVYLGLKAGMTVSASIPAAVMAMLILRGVFRSGTLLEGQSSANRGFRRRVVSCGDHFHHARLAPDRRLAAL